MNAAFENKALNSRSNLDSDKGDEEYFGDFFNDESCLLEELDIYENLADEDVANDDIWDIMQIDEVEDTAGWLIY